VLDKTGTLTNGEPEVVAVVTADALDERELLRAAAAVERESELHWRRRSCVPRASVG
jgi:Cu+-exporting ATPase